MKRFQKIVDKSSVDPCPIQFQRKKNIIVDIQIRDQVILLENKAYLPPAEYGKPVVIQRFQSGAAHSDASACGGVQSAQHMEQGGFSASISL